VEVKKMSTWVKIRMSQEDNWMHVRAGETGLQLSKPASYIPNFSIRFARHGAVGIERGEAVALGGHIVEYNPNFPAFGVSIVHELSHAKTDELGYFCFPPLTGEADRKYERSWSWIDECYAHRTLARYAEGLFDFELAVKVGMLSQFDPDMTKAESLMHNLCVLALYEALIDVLKVDAATAEKLGEVVETWTTRFKAAPRLWAHKELLRAVLSGLPELEKLTKERYVDSGLEILYSRYIRPETTISRDDYRRQVSRVVKRIRAEPGAFSSPMFFFRQMG